MTDTINEARRYLASVQRTQASREVAPREAWIVQGLLAECERIRADLERTRAELARVTAERDTLSHRPNVCEALDLVLDAVRQKERAEAAEAELAAARAAMPSDGVYTHVKAALRGYGGPVQHDTLLWLRCLDAYHAAHPAASTPNTTTSGGDDE